MRVRTMVALLVVLAVAAAGCTGSDRSAPPTSPGRGAQVGASPAAPPATSAPSPATSSAPPSPSPSPEPAATTVPREPTARDRRLLVVWIRGELPAATVDAVRRIRSVAAVAPVAEGTLWLGSPTPAHGRQRAPATPLDTAAASVPDLRAVLGDRPWLRNLARDEAVLSSTSAVLRGAPGLLRLGNATVPVGAVVPDQDVGAHEVFLSDRLGERFGLGGADYLLVRIADRADARAAEAAVRRAAAGTVAVAVRVRSQAETAYLRQGDGVMPPEWTKVYFGEFRAVAAGGDIVIDPSWVRDHIATERVPILGDVTCNRAFLPPLRATLRAIVRAGLGRLVDPAHYGGCFAARLIRGSTSQLSQHAYGAAIDVNVADNLLGAVPTQDRRLVDAFARNGFVWGGDFLLPDGMHFEYGCPAALALHEQTRVPEHLAGLALCRGA